MSEPILLTEQQAADYLSMSVQTFRREKIPSVKFKRENARMKRWHRQTLDNWSQSRQTEPTIQVAKARQEQKTKRPRIDYSKVPPTEVVLKLLKGEATRSKEAALARRKHWVKEIPEQYINNDMGGLVYFIDCGGLTKIGHTSQPIYKRMEAWLTGNPFDLKIFALMPGGEQRERELHLRFASARKKGEWFDLPQAMRDAITDIVIDAGGIIMEGTANERAA